jgi:hypothetical protein
MTRSNWQNLNGVWEFQSGAAGDSPPFGQTLPESVLVPYPIESALSGIMRHQDWMWYHRTFTVPANWSGQRVLLNFGAVDWQSTLYINHQNVGTHAGGYDAFSYDITNYLTAGSNDILLQVYNPVDNGEQPLGKQRLNPNSIWYTAASGIWQTVWLEPVPTSSIANLVITPDVDNQSLRLTVQGAGNTSGYSVSATALTNGTTVSSATGSVGTEFRIPMPNAQLWSPDSPFLYDLQVVLKNSSGGTVDQVGSYFGMRKVGLAPLNGVLRPMINNQFVFEMGPLDQGYWPDGIYTAPTDDALRSDIQKSKDLGFNMIRKHIKVEPARWYYWADKLGMLVWQDMPAMPTGKTISAAGHQQYELELQRMVDLHHNSPSIILWVVFNEGWAQYDTVRVTNNVIAQDPSRLVDDASGWTDAGVGSVVDNHTYVGPSSPTPTASRAAVLGEFGGLGLKVNGHDWSPNGFSYENQSDSTALTNRYVGLISQVQALMASPGLSAAVYTEIFDVENEINGLWTYDRAVAKPDTNQIRTANLNLINASKALNGTFKRQAYWSFDEGSGATAHDGTGNGNTASLTGSPTWNAGKINGGLNFNGSSQNVSANRSIVDTTGSYSVAAWVQLSTTPGGSFYTAVSQDGNNVSGFFLQYSGADGKFAFSVTNADSTNSTTTRALGNATPSANTWYHLVGVRDAANNQIKLYVNGALVSTQAYSSSWAATGNTMIGRGKWNAGSVDYWPGNLDEVYVYDHAITDQNVMNLYNGGLTGYWAFNEGNGSTANDSSGGGNTGTLANGPTWVGGKNGSALNFNGSNQSVNINHSVVDTTGSYSVAAWVQLSATPGSSFYTAVSQDGNNVSGFYLQYSGADGKFAFSAINADSINSSTARALAPSAPSANTWYHLVGVYDAINSQIRLYVNGSLVSTQAFINGWSASGNTVIGRGKWSGNPVDFWPGLIDQVRTYNRVLSGPEIQGLYNSGT